MAGTQRTRNRPIAIGSRLVALMFAGLGVVSAISGEWLDASVWLALTAALLVLGAEDVAWRDMPLWRRLIGSALTILGVGALLLRLWLDFTT